jgi:methionyl-tRNA formyltransferase
MQNSKKLNFVFFGTPDVARGTLEILKENGYLPSLIVTAPDRPQGREMLITPPPVKVWAIENNILYTQPEKLKREEIWDVLGTLGRSDGDGQRKFSAKNFRGEQNIPDLFLVVAYGKIIPEEILNMPKFGSINIHYSLLPKYRGASPVESVILNGEIETGVTIQKMKFKLDSGPIMAVEKTKILETETAPELKNRLIKIGGDLLVKVLNTPSPSGRSPFAEGDLIEQDENEATFCKKIKKEDGQIDLNSDAVKNYNKFRAYAHWPRTFFFKNDKRIIITEAVLENKNFVIKKVLPEGKKEVKYEDFLKTNTLK